MVTALPTDQRRAVLEAMLQPLVQTAESLLAPPGAGSPVEEASRRKDLILATFDRMAVVFKCDAIYSHCSYSCPHSDSRIASWRRRCALIVSSAVGMSKIPK